MRLLTVSGWPGLLDPVGEVAHKVEEEVSLGHRDHLVRNLDKEAEALGGAEAQPLRDVLAEVLGAGRGVNFECLKIFFYHGNIAISIQLQ